MKFSQTLLAGLFAVLFASLYSGAYGQSQYWEWAKVGAHSGNLEAGAVAIGFGSGDGSNDGIYTLSHDLGGNPYINLGAITVSNPGNFPSIVVKHSLSGTALWGFPLQGNCTPLGIATDPQGNVYVLGTLADSVLLGSTWLKTTNHEYIVAKISPSGTVIWARKDGGGCYGSLFLSPLYPAPGGGIKCDAAGNVYVTSYFYTAITVIGGDTLVNAGAAGTIDMFLAKYDPSGNVIWAERAGGTGDDYARVLSVSPAGKICVTGSTSSPTVAFGSYTFTTVPGKPKMFITMFDSSGHPTWADATGKVNADYVCGAAHDKWGNIFLSGTFNDTFIINGTSVINPRAGTGSLFLVKMDTTNHVAWYKTGCSPAGSVSPNNLVFGRGVATDECGSVWVEGSMGGYLTKGMPYVDVSGHRIDSAPGVYPYPSHMSDPGFIAGFNAMGGYIGGKALQSGFDDYNGIVCGPGGSLYLSTDFVNAKMITANDTHVDNSDIEKYMLVKYKYDTLGCARLRNSGADNPAATVTAYTLYPNPATTECTIQCTTSFQPGATAELYDLTGRHVSAHPLTGEATTMHTGHLPPGIYQCRIRNGAEVVVRKLVKQQ